MSPAPAAFYCVADSRYFLGAVAMINSLRLHGHSEPVYMLDAGLEPWQRQLLEREVKLVDAPTSGQPWLLKTIAPLAHPAEAMVLLDADMIVCRSLGELFERAGAGAVVAFDAGYERFVPEWGRLLGIGDPAPGPYVSSGVLALDSGPGLELLRRMEALRDRVQELVEADRHAAEPEFAFFALDQDLLNALVASEPFPLVALPARLAPVHPFPGLRPDERGDSCIYADGVVPYVVHQLLLTAVPVLGPRPGKPWLEPQPTTLYTRLLARFLLGERLALAPPPEEVPVWLRGGARGRLARLRPDARERLGWLARRRLPAGVVERIDARRRTRSKAQ